MDLGTTPGARHLVAGSIRLRRIGGFGFPLAALESDGALVAHLGRDGWFRIYFGRGRRVRLVGGQEWRIRATTRGRCITPIVTSQAGKIATSGPLTSRRSYGINGKDYGYTLFPMGRVGWRRPGLWVLRQHGIEIAAIEDHERTIHTTQPLPLGAVLLVFTLNKHGIPGAADLIPGRR